MRRHETVRLCNLELLVAEAGSAAALARRARTSDSYLSQVRNRLKTKRGTPRSIGDDLAEKLEQAMGKPVGWMDEAHADNGAACAPSDATPIRLSSKPLGSRRLTPELPLTTLHPLISWEAAAVWNTLPAAERRAATQALLPSPVACSSKTFLLRVQGESMCPRFCEGELIVVDPDAEAADGRYIVVRDVDVEQALLRYLIIEGGRRYIKAVNPDWPGRISALHEAAEICGVVVFKGEAL